MKCQTSPWRWKHFFPFRLLTFQFLESACSEHGFLVRWSNGMTTDKIFKALSQRIACAAAIGRVERAFKAVPGFTMPRSALRVRP